MVAQLVTNEANIEYIRTKEKEKGENQIKMVQQILKPQCGHVSDKLEDEALTFG